MAKILPFAPKPDPLLPQASAAAQIAIRSVYQRANSPARLDQLLLALEASMLDLYFEAATAGELGTVLDLSGEHLHLIARFRQFLANALEETP